MNEETASPASSIVRRVFLEVAPQPPRGDPRMPARIFARDQQRQLERVFEAELRELPRGGERRDYVASL